MNYVSRIYYVCYCPQKFIRRSKCTSLSLRRDKNTKKLLELYRSSQDPVEKKELLEYLVMMGSDNVWDIIDSALDGGF